MAQTNPSACGGYITKGTSICQMNAIPKEVLESKVIETVLDFYRSYLEKGGRQKLAEAVKAQTGTEKEDITSARQRAQTELESITKTINNLLDNITETNRDHRIEHPIGTGLNVSCCRLCGREG